jgi:hypothetical protein
MSNSVLTLIIYLLLHKMVTLLNLLMFDNKKLLKNSQKEPTLIHMNIICAPLELMTNTLLQEPQTHKLLFGT